MVTDPTIFIASSFVGRAKVFLVYYTSNNLVFEGWIWTKKGIRHFLYDKVNRFWIISRGFKSAWWNREDLIKIRVKGEVPKEDMLTLCYLIAKQLPDILQVLERYNEKEVTYSELKNIVKGF